MKRKLKRAVITGPTGAVGTALCRELAENGIEVIAVCRPGSARLGAVPSHDLIRTVQCDVSNLADLPRLIPEGADAFYHLAWAHTTGAGRNDMPAQINNIRYTIDAVGAAHALGCQVFVGAGSQAEYGRVEGLLRPDTPCFPENGYGIAKLCAGQMSRIECAKLGLDHIWTRILSVYGPGDGAASMISSVIRSLLARERPALTAGVQLWDYLYSRDAATAFRLLAEHGVSGRIYPLGGGHARPLREYIEILRDSIDPALPLGLGEIPYGPLQVMHLEADITALKEDTGFVPATDFTDGIRATVRAYKKTNGMQNM
ncbi:MAG: NAD(P)-dependent oxidoreductase [Clostridia bacterium]|nr:NAD(P)-dependent oxidoreductase [Clostridia bacterium]